MARELFGIPWDRTSLGRRGSRLGPEAIRAELLRLHPYSRDDRRVVSWSWAETVDCGRSHDQMVERVATAFERSHRRSAGDPVVFLGGDNGISYAGVRAVRTAFPNLSVVLIDSHFDLRSPDSTPTNGNWASRLLKESRIPFWTLGIGRFANDGPLFDSARSLGIRWLSSDALRAGTVSRVLAQLFLRGLRGRDVYLALDIDALDQAQAPGASAPSPDGLTVREVRSILEFVARNAKVRAMDITEVNPVVDRTGRTARVAAYLVMSFLSTIREPSPRRE